MKQLTLLQWTLMLVSMLTIMSGTPIATTLPAIEASFIGAQNLQLYVRLVLTMPALFVVFCAPVAGWLADRFGRKPVLLIALFIYAVAGSSGYIAQSLPQLLIGRALLGLGVAGIMGSVTALISDYFDGEERARLMGLQGAFTTAAGVVFISLGGFLADLSWRLPFLIYLLGFVMLYMAVVVLYEPKAVQQANLTAQSHKRPVKLLVFLYGVAIFGHIGFYVLPVQLPFFLRESYGLSGFQIGLVLSLATVFATLASLRYAFIKSRLAYADILVFIFSVMSLGLMLVGSRPPLVLLVLGLCTVGLSAGLLVPTLNNWISEAIDAPYRARALGFLVTAIFSGQFLCPLLAAPLVNLVLPAGAEFIVFGGVMLGFAGILIVVNAPLKRYSHRLSLQQNP